MSESYTFYAIKGADGEFFSNHSYGGGWRPRPKLWSRKQDAQVVLLYGAHSRRSAERFLASKVVRFEVKEIE